MTWASALFTPGRMDEKTGFFLAEARMAHDRITNLLILTYPMLAGVWQFRETARHFTSLSDPVRVRDAVLSFIDFPRSETAVRRLDFTESVSNVSWERQRDSAAEMMFLVCCSIYENFTSHVQDAVIASTGASGSSRPIEKGFQFPSTDYDLTAVPPNLIGSIYSTNINVALSHFPLSTFMVSHLLPTYPHLQGRNLLEDFEKKMHTYLLFKMLRNSISHGRFDTKIPRQHEIVDKMVDAASQGVARKITLSTSGLGDYYVTLFDVVGFTSLLLKMIQTIDQSYLLSQHGEGELLRRLATTKDAKQFGPSDRKREFTRLQLCLKSLGVNGFHVDEAARTHFINHGAWRP